MQIGCTLAPYLCFVNKPKGLRQVNPKFNFCVMNEQEKVFGDFRICVRYEPCVNPIGCKYYYVECWDYKFSVKMEIDWGEIDNHQSISMEDAVAKVKEYFRCRLNNADYWDNFIRP